MTQLLDQQPTPIVVIERLPGLISFGGDDARVNRVVPGLVGLPAAELTHSGGQDFPVPSTRIAVAPRS